MVYSLEKKVRYRYNIIDNIIEIMISISKTSIIPDNHAELEGSRL